MTSTSPKEALTTSFEEAVNAIMDDTALLMHGSGDVLPADANPETVRLVASLTVQYISNLVDAALDTHAMMRDNPVSRKIPWVPPAAKRHSRQPPIPPPPIEPEQQLPESMGGHALTYWRQGSRKHQRSSNEECWDLGLPPPKIRKKTKVEDPPPTVDEWVGVAGIDFYENRTRAAHCMGALTTQAFVFPVCHDVYVYGRILHVQAAKRNLDSILQDAALLKVVRAEGKSKDASGGAGDPEEEAEGAAADEFEQGPTWPGMAGLMPVHRHFGDNILRSILD